MLGPGSGMLGEGMALPCLVNHIESLQLIWTDGIHVDMNHLKKGEVK